jgi:hypothetical protein
MQKKRTIKLISAFIFLLFTTNCGRKQKNFFLFPQEEVAKINKLDLPAVNGVTAQKTDYGVYISWFPLFPEKVSPSTKQFEKNFIGFNVFRLENGALFIPKNPINKEPTRLNYHIDAATQTKNNASYTVQPIFKFGEKIIGGPSSQIIKTSD